MSYRQTYELPSDLWEVAPREEGEEVTVACDHCGRDFVIQLVDVQYTMSWADHMSWKVRY
jgi:hypothetical protein